MAKSTELAKERTVTGDGVLTSTVLDTVSADRMVLSLIRGSTAALYGSVEDLSPVVPRGVKDVILSPFSEL
tara:strand:- start:1476 stop:1688 length:213 start_codon:yes stop_codon:yes gene_type:complete